MRQTIEQVTDPFYSPFDNILIKGTEEDGKWIVYLEASNELKDQDGEVVETEALKKASDYYLEQGILSWDHKHRQLHDPKFIIGEPLDVRFSENRTLVKGFLYKFNEIAQSVWNNIRSDAKKVGASIGGGILHKAKQRIRQVIWSEIALTYKPINAGTFGKVQLVPFATFAKALQIAENNEVPEDFWKALMAGSGVDAANFTGGRALAPESLQGNTVDIIPGEDMRGLFSDLLKAIRSNRIVDYNDMINFVLDRGYDGGVANQLINYIAKKMPSVVGALR